MCACMDTYVHVLYKHRYAWYYSVSVSVSCHAGQNSSDSGHAEGILRCCKYPVNSFLTEIVRIIVAFFKNVVYLVFLMADLVVLVNRFQCYVAKP